MGGFHGGHSGGFHGGHSGGFRGGSRHVSRVYYHRGHYGGYEGEGSPGAALLAFGLLMNFIGAIVFFCFFSIKTTATITDVEFVDLYGTRNDYWKYDFTYKAYGSEYEGHGDDDYHYKDEFKVGDKYPIYFKLCSPSSYNFDGAGSAGAATFAAIFVGIGITLSVFGIKRIIKDDTDEASIRNTTFTTKDGKFKEEAE